MSVRPPGLKHFEFLVCPPGSGIAKPIYGVGKPHETSQALPTLTVNSEIEALNLIRSLHLPGVELREISAKSCASVVQNIALAEAETSQWSEAYHSFLIAAYRWGGFINHFAQSDDWRDAKNMPVHLPFADRIRNFVRTLNKTYVPVSLEASALVFNSRPIQISMESTLASSSERILLDAWRSSASAYLGAYVSWQLMDYNADKSPLDQGDTRLNQLREALRRFAAVHDRIGMNNCLTALSIGADRAEKISL